MHGDFSRTTFSKNKRLKSVRMQQGRVQLDADWNEQVDLTEQRTHTEAIDVIGRAGGPKQALGFSIDPDSASATLRIGAGRYYVEGRLVENPQLATYGNQPFLRVGTNGVPHAGAPGIYLAYLEVFDRTVSPVDDPSLREVALGGPDTAVRTQTVWQVKLLRLGDRTMVITDPNQDFAPWTSLISGAPAQLRARVVPPPPSEERCALPSAAAYRGLDNQLYRVEVQRVNGAAVSLKWARDNASFVVPVEAVASTTTLRVAEPALDDLTRLAANDWIEVSDERRDLTFGVGFLVQVDRVVGNEVLLKTATPLPAVNAIDAGARPRIRKWHHLTGTVDGFPAGNDFVALEEGIQVRLDAGVVRPGDHWLIPARTALHDARGALREHTGDIEWPRDTTGNPLGQVAHGTERFFKKLALLDYDGTVFRRPDGWDLRKRFPALTELTAADVAYDNRVCQLPGVRTVQDALDALCGNHGGDCTLLATPGTDLQVLFDRLAAQQGARVCFMAGTYTLPRTIRIEGKGDLLLSGAGAATLLTGPGVEALLKFTGCKSVVVRDLALQSGTGTGDNLDGALTFVDCGSVSVEGVQIEVGPRQYHEAAGIAVRGAPGSCRSARVVRSEVLVGDRQVGIVLSNVGRVHVEDNVVRALSERAISWDTRINASEYRERLKLELINSANPGLRNKKLTNANILLQAGELRVSFATPTYLVAPWNYLLYANPPQRGVLTDLDFLQHLKNLAHHAIMGRGVVGGSRQFVPYFESLLREDRVTGTHGVMVGGQVSSEVRIRQNRIIGFQECVNVGLSHRESAAGTPDIAPNVTIDNNTLEVHVTAGSVRGRHGVFVGNCDSLRITENHITRRRLFSRARPATAEAIRVYGHLGKLAIIRENHLFDFELGIRIRPYYADQRQAMWLVSRNFGQGVAVLLSREGNARWVIDADNVRV